MALPTLTSHQSSVTTVIALIAGVCRTDALEELTAGAANAPPPVIRRGVGE